MAELQHDGRRVVIQTPKLGARIMRYELADYLRWVSSRADQKSAAPALAATAPLMSARSGTGGAVPGSRKRLVIG